MPGRAAPAVIVASDEAALLDEIVRHLDQIPHWRLVGSARSATTLLEALGEHAPDALLISDGLARDMAAAGDPSTFGSARIVVIGRQEHPATFKAALRIGARGFVRWPGEQRELRQMVESGLAAERPHRPGRGGLTSIWGPKGGSGTSTIAAHLAGALASLETDTMIVDLDLDHADQSAILSAPEGKNLVDLARMVDEITPAVIDSVAWRHPRGFRALLSPGSSGESGLVKAADAARLLGLVRESVGLVIADLPSGYSELVYSVAEEATRVLMVVTPDLLSLRRARDAMQMFATTGIELVRIEIVLNRSRSGDISAADVETVVGRPIVAQVPPDAGLLRAPDRGELAASGMRLLDPLARRIAGLPTPAPRGARKLFRV